MAIERRIRPLVDALNATGLVQTFTSCEGHYGDEQPARSTGRDRAYVGFFLREGVPEHVLSRVFGAVLAEYRLRGSTGAELTIAKHYVAALDGAEVPEVFFDFTVCPSDPRSPGEAKRAVTDQGLAVVTRAVEEARGGSAPSWRFPEEGADRRGHAPGLVLLERARGGSGAGFSATNPAT